MNHLQIRKVNVAAVLPMRQRLLKPHLALSDCRNPGDDKSDTFHLAAFLEAEMLGTASFEIENPSVDLGAGPWARLRGMAVDPKSRRLGVGRSLVMAGEENVRELGCKGLWFNARESAFPFYEVLGFQYFGELFELPHIGPHKVMYKHW